MLQCYVTDRRAIGGRESLLRNIERLGQSIDFLQVREKDLEGRELAQLVRDVLRAAHPQVRVLVNDRADVARACGAHGVHLRGNALAPEQIRSLLSPGMVISVSCHTPSDVEKAGREGADLVVFGPVFASPGKGAGVGVGELERVAGLSTVPLLALGGITEQNAAECMRAGAAGIAGIRLFQRLR